ncbi:MAG: beta-lactamase family protein [Neomegalonema sp.]|nr:beta-lactamase family protein [Neomegalonema sp.]
MPPRTPIARAAMFIALGLVTLGFFLAGWHALKPANAETISMDEALRRDFAAEKLPGLHAALVLHRGEVVSESYFPGEDEAWGSPLGRVEHGPDTLHDLRSVTKSIVGLLYGIALAQGHVPAPDASLLDQFPEYSGLPADPRRSALTIGHVLTMSMGTEWDETLPYTDPRNSEIAMEQAPDRLRFILDRPMIAQPGESWTYNGGATALIAALIVRGTGKDLESYAREVLFTPLGIEHLEWARGEDGAHSGASGLRLTARGLARIGEMILADGVWQGRRIVPADWLRESFTKRAEAEGLGYGYLWWLAPWGKPAPAWVAGFGNGGQRMTVQASADLVIVVFAGNYNQPDAWRIPVSVIEDYAVPAVKRRLE